MTSQGIEPEHKRLRSIAKRNKEPRKEARDKHAVLLRRVSLFSNNFPAKNTFFVVDLPPLTSTTIYRF